MFKRFRSVSMLLFLGGISVGVAHATPSMLEANVVQQSNVCKGVVQDAQGETIIGANVFKDFFAGIRDIVGGRAGSYESV